LSVSFNTIYSALGITKQAFHDYCVRHRHKAEMLGYLENLIMKIRRDHPTLALRTIHSMVGKIGIGRDQFEEYFLSIGFGIERRKIYWKTTDSRGVSKFENLVKEIVINQVDQVWVSDITYFELQNRFYYITFITDAFSRRIVGHSLSTTLITENTSLSALKMALKCRRYSKENKPGDLIFHSDGGGQYYAGIFIEQLRLLGIKSSMAEDVYENAIAERVNGIIKNNYLVHRSITSYVQLKKELDRSVALYNSQKPHRSLKNETPIAYELKMAHVCSATKTDGDELINGKLKKKGASSPISSWQQKPQAWNLSPEIQV